MKTKTIAITGATSGIGFAVSKLLASHGYHLICVGRTKETCDIAKQKILKEFPAANITYFFGDLMQQSEVNRISAEITAYLDEHTDDLDVLINNAGCVRSWYTTTEDGYEQQFALNHLAGFLLTFRLLPYLKKSKGSVIITGSGSHKMMKIHWKDIMFSNKYNPLLAYKQSKLCNILFAYEFNNLFYKDGVKAFVVDPGLVNTDIGNKQTGGIINTVWSYRKKHGVSADVPAKTYAFLCEQDNEPDGLYYYLCEKQKYSKYVNSENAERLFRLSEKLTDIQYGELI